MYIWRGYTIRRSRAYTREACTPHATNRATRGRKEGTLGVGMDLVRTDGRYQESGNHLFIYLGRTTYVLRAEKTYQTRERSHVARRTRKHAALNMTSQVSMHTDSVLAM